LKNATYINWETLQFIEGNLKVEKGLGGKISFIDSLPELKEGDELMDCRNKFVTKSFGCGHHHIYSALARGMGAPKKQPNNFYEILKYIWWVLDKCLDKDIIEASALATAIACAKRGVTFVIDHHSSPYAAEGSLETIAKAFDKVGINHLLCIELSDRDGEEPKEEGLEETINYLSSGRQGLVGLHASFTVSGDLLNKAVGLCNNYNSGIHVHVAEDQMDQDLCIKDHGRRVLERFEGAGVLSFPKTILSHCIHINEHEKSLVLKSPAWIAQNTESNLNNCVGLFNSEGLSDRIILGTDGMHSDMIRSAQNSYFTSRLDESYGLDILYHRFRNIHRYIQTNNFLGDGENNIVVLNYDSPTELNEKNFLSHFLYGIESSHVESVISQGSFILKEGKIINVNEDEVLSFSKEMGKRLWFKMDNCKEDL